MAFVRTGFDGQLPAKFMPATSTDVGIVDGTSELTRAGPFNMVNKEELSRYVHIDECDYFVDLDLAEEEQEDGKKGKGEASGADGAVPARIDGRPDAAQWTAHLSAPFLDAGRSSALFRAFYVPGFSARRNKYLSYTLYIRNGLYEPGGE